MASSVMDAAQRYRMALLRFENSRMRQLVNEYGRIWSKLSGRIEALESEVLALLAEGIEPIGIQYRLTRHRALRQQVEQELARFGGWADTEISRNARDAIAMGVQHSRGITAAVGGRAILAEFNQLPVGAIETMLGFLSDASPLHDAITTRLGTEVGLRVEQALIDGIALGVGPRQVARGMLRNMVREQVGQGLTWAMRTSRTSMLWSYREAWRMNALANPNIIEGYVRMSARDGRVCMGCVALDGKFFPLTQPLNDHHNGRCVVGDTLVGGPPVKSFVTRHYDGDVLTISLASGQQLTVTPNHPILTDRGWVAAELLCNGDNVICGGFEDGASSGMAPDKYQAPTLIQDIPGSLGMFRLGSVPCTAENFHGDGKGSDVYVVWANSLLGDGGKAADIEPFVQQHFGLGRAVLPGLFGLGDFATMFKGMFSATADFLGDLDAAMMLFYRSLLGQELIGLGDSAAINTGYFQPLGDNTARYTEALSKGILGFPDQIPRSNFVNGNARLGHSFLRRFNGGEPSIFFEAPEQAPLFQGEREPNSLSVDSFGSSLNTITGEVSLDRILEIGVRAFSGHVYNLHTTTEWYNASSSIAHNGSCCQMPIVHNCAPLAKVRGVGAPDIGTGEDWFKNLDPAEQQQMMGPGKYAAWKAQEFDFGQLVGSYNDPIYGSLMREETLRGILGDRALDYYGKAA